MSGVGRALWGEMLKARRSRMPLLTALAFALAPLAGGFFMIILKDPELARRTGMISAKAQITAGAADWPTYLGMLAQAMAVGGVLLFSLILTWVFGREYANATLKDLLALPTSRSAIVAAKFVLVALWAVALTIFIYLIGLGVGLAVRLPPAPDGVILQGSLTLAVTAILTLLVVTPIAFFASAGRGYLAPMGVAILTLIAAQVIAATGWGEFFPWAIPALYARLAGPATAPPGSPSYLIVVVTAVAGMAATLAWWNRADQTQ